MVNATTDIHQYSALIVGAGRFSRNYLRTMADINRETRSRSSGPAFDPVIVTRTRYDKAHAMASEVRQRHGEAFKRILAAVVNDAQQLREVLSEHNPDLICITARDREQGDRIHADYSRISLDFGMVLCEKPFSAAQGDGSSLTLLDDLLKHPQAHRFGLHLPMAVVLQAMQKHNRLGPLLENAAKLYFLWQKQGAKGGLVNDLAPHPWSLIPHPTSISVQRFYGHGQAMNFDFRWQPSTSRHTRTGRLTLQTGGNFRGMCIDTAVIQFRFESGELQVLELDTSWQEVLVGPLNRINVEVLLRVQNPLQQHILSLLKGRPLVDMQYTYHCQRFLESTQYLFNSPNRGETQ